MAKEKNQRVLLWEWKGRETKKKTERDKKTTKKTGRLQDLDFALTRTWYISGYNQAQSRGRRELHPSGLKNRISKKTEQKRPTEEGIFFTGAARHSSALHTALLYN